MFPMNWPAVPALGRVWYVRHTRREQHSWLKEGGGPNAALHQASEARLSSDGSFPIDPLLARALNIAKIPIAEVYATRSSLLKHWEEIASLTEDSRSQWLSELPAHSRQLYEQSGFHGPLFHEMFKFLRKLGYPDANLWRDICHGFPTGRLLSRSGLWPEHPKAAQLQRERRNRQEAFDRAPNLLRDWRSKRKADPFVKELLERNADECAKRRRVEVDIRTLKDGTFVAHPEFMVVSGESRRACDDCTVSGWNGTSASLDKLQLPGTDDIVDYGSRLLLDDPLCNPQLGVADEEAAFRNWPNGCPEAMIMCIFLGGGRVRAFKDFALCFGDSACVYA